MAPTGKWDSKDIVYMSLAGVIIAMALVEWVLWLAAFLYCLIRAFLQANKWSVRLLSAVVGILFILLRLILLPVLVVTLPLPGAITQSWPQPLVAVLRWFAFGTFAVFLTVPLLLCVYQLVSKSVGRKAMIKEKLDENTAPKVVVVMPCYHEDPDTLITAIDSVVECDYPPSCIHLFLSFDGDQIDALYLHALEKLGVLLLPSLGVVPTSIDAIYKGARITISRFPHGGKRHCQRATFRLIDRIYDQYLEKKDDLFVLFIDSDCILDRLCLQNFMYDMELSPGNPGEMLAMTGVITTTTQKHSLVTLLQDLEYVHNQLFDRTVEAATGSFCCLPGALTILRLSAFRELAQDIYFADRAEEYDSLFDYARCYLGEDRWLTHLFMTGAKKRYQIQMCPSAFCKTEAVQTFQSLVKQRRRWFLGSITNEVCMLTDWRLWRLYPVLIIVRFMNNTLRSTALLFLVIAIALATSFSTADDLPFGFIATSLGMNWILMVYFGFKLHRYKLLLYPLLFLVNPFLTWYYMVYGTITARQRTWGGPRADAAAADDDTCVGDHELASMEKLTDNKPESYTSGEER
ncbi:hypothetical protein HIM_05790 [Hirsutella minnesotensis 3608]|uniref:chitin synthase n=1 Tax=Hirsutella minnesotensis 3608 TaxID=1043627 RepID=A0A0F7ZK17_9HYPO|nr:hypothetical protein HIM_05790 [Hirsutella minnesotensis 3608]